MSSRERAVMIVVATLAIVTLIYMSTLSACALMKIEITSDTLGYMKDVGLVALGALSSLLARTSSPDDTTKDNPLPTQIVNPPENPVNVHDEKKP